LGAGTALAKDAITIAVPSFLTGGAAGPFGIPAMNGAKMVADAINAGKLPAPYDSKGFGGATATVEPIDEGGGATKQVAEYRNLVEKRGVDAIVGYISSGNCQALAPIAEELKQFTIFATCGTPRIFEEAPRKYVFRTMGHATADNVAAAMYVKEKYPDLMCDGEMQADVAVNPKILENLFPFSNLKSSADILIFPDLNSANISYKLLTQLSDCTTIGPILTPMKKNVNIFARTATISEMINMTIITSTIEN